MGRAGDRQMIRTALAALAILTAITPAPARQREAAAPSLIEVFVAGEGAYHTYRIPSAILTPKGTLLAFAEGRRAGAGDAGDIDLVLRRSHDGGHKWTAIQVI